MDTNTIIEGTLKFRDGKKWKSRWCVLRKLSPVADCVHVQLYRDSKERHNNGQTKASLSLQHFLVVQSGFTLDKESNTLAILCEDVTVVFAFDTREQLIQWQAKIAINLGEDEQFSVQISSAPGHKQLCEGTARLHVLERRFCLTDGMPPRLLGHWQIAQLRKFGVVDGRFCFEGGSKCGKGEGLHVLLTDRADAVARAFQSAAHSPAPTLSWRAPQRHSHIRERSISSSRTEANICSQWYPEGDCQSRDHRSRSQENLCWSPADWTREATISSDIMDSYHREESESRPRCRSCHVRMARSSTVTGLTWTMDPYNGGMLRSSTTSLEHSQHSSCGSVRALSDIQRSCRPPPRPPKTRNIPLEVPAEFPAYRRPRPSPSFHALGMCGCDKKYGTELLSPTLEDMGEEYYDTPRNLRNTIFDHSMAPSLNCCHTHANFTSRCGTDVNSRLTHSTSVSQSLMRYPETSCRNKLHQSLFSHNNRSRSRNLSLARSHSIHADDEPSSLSSEPAWHQESTNTCECYVNVQENLCQAKKCVKSVTFSELPQNIVKPQPNYVNIDFAESLKFYENCSYSKVSDCCEKEFVKNSKNLPIKFSESVSCKNCGKSCGVKPAKLERSVSLPVQEEPPGYIRMSSLTKHFTENCSDSCASHKDPPLLPFRPKSNSFLCLNEPHRNHRLYSVKSISDPEINLIPICKKRPKIALSKIIELLSNVRPVTAQEIRKYAKKPSMPSYRNRIDESQYHSDDTLSSDTMVNTANDISVKGSMSSMCSEIANQIVASRFLSVSELNLSLCSFEGLKPLPGNEQVESDLKKYKDHLRSLELPRLPLDSEYIICDKTGFSTVRRSHTLTFKPGHNRDSSSSNDSGVSTASLRLRKADFIEFEMPVTTSLSAKLLREYALSLAGKSSSDLSLPRRSKSIDPLGELVFQFQDSSGNAKSTSALLNVEDGKDGRIMRFIDAPSTSSGTSDLSDYMDNLSISSYSSNDHPRNVRCAMPTLKPRSGKEYHKIDRLSLQPSDQVVSCSKSKQLS